MEYASQPYKKAFVSFAERHPEVLCISADLTSSCEIDLFRSLYPERFFSMGMAEQNMLSFCGGLALEGFRPFVHSFAVFLYRRALDQLVCSIAYSNRRVRLMGFLPGIMTPGGITHQAIEDIAAVRSIPNMTVLETGDASEVETVLETADAVDGPVYVRVLRGNVPRLFTSPFRFNKLRKLSSGKDLLILSSGIGTHEAIKAVKALGAGGLGITLLHASTLKPFACDELLKELSNIKYGVITIENHTVTGGLGSIAAEVMAGNGIPLKLIRLGLQDTFAHGASTGYLLKEYSMDAYAVIMAAEQLLNTKLNIDREDLSDIINDTTGLTANPEDL